MHLVSSVTELLTLLEVFDDVPVVTRRCDKRRQPVEAGHDAVLDLSGGNMTRPAENCWGAEAALETRSLSSGERRVSAVGPSEVFSAIVGGDDNDRVVGDAHVLELFRHLTDNVVELGHAGLFRAVPV